MVRHNGESLISSGPEQAVSELDSSGHKFCMVMVIFDGPEALSYGLNFLREHAPRLPYNTVHFMHTDNCMLCALHQSPLYLYAPPFLPSPKNFVPWNHFWGHSGMASIPIATAAQSHIFLHIRHNLTLFTDLHSICTFCVNFVVQCTQRPGDLD